MKFEHWKIVESGERINIMASDGSSPVNIGVVIDKQTGAVLVNGSPDLTIVESNGRTQNCILTLHSCQVNGLSFTSWGPDIKDSDDGKEIEKIMQG